ncbi:MAG: TonB-dependent receptor [Gemmatirosa sp.]
MRALPFRTGALALPGALVAVLLGAFPAAHAQTATSSLRGYVRNPAGTPVSDAQVGARSAETNAVRGAATNAAGFYYIGGLRPGRYEVTVRRVGFTPQSRTLQLQIGQTVDLNLTIAEATVTLSTVTVEAQAGGSTARTSEVGSNISREQIQNLPNFERNVLDLAKLVPGVTATSPNSSDKTIAAGGQPSEAVNVFVDGATYKNDVLRGGVVGQDASKGNPFPQGAIQEFRVLTQNYKAEYQKAASAIITASTRSGTNAFEADAFAYGVGRTYVARDAFTADRAGPRPNYQRLQAGFNLGGPIQRDRLFAFGTYELNFRDEPAIVRFNGDSARAPAALLQQLRPNLGQEAQEFRQHLGFGKLTWIAGDRSTVDVSATIRSDEDFRGFGGTTAFSAAENVAIDVYTGVANWRRAGDRFLNEAQVNAQYMKWNPTARDFTTVGRDYGFIRVGGKDSNQEFEQTRLSLRDDVTRAGVQLAGDHVFKGGVNADFLAYRSEKFQNFNPVFRFRPEEQYARPYEASFGFGDPDVTSNNVQFGAYLQDDWTIGRLVLNLGVRWDAETNMINNDYVTPRALADSLRGPLAGQFYVEQPLAAGGTVRRRVVDELGGIERYISTGRDSRPIYWKAFQPRVGASFDVFGTGGTVVFGGVGLYFDRNYWNTLLDEQFRRQFSVLNVAFRGSAAECAASDRAATCAVWDERYYDPTQLRTLRGSSGLPEVFLVANDMEPPRTMQLSGGVRQAIGTLQATVSYNGVRGRNFMNFIRATPFGGLAPNYAVAFITDDRVKTWYDALQVQLERPLRGTSRWGGSLAYTLARSEEQGQSQDLFWGFDDRFPTVGDRPRRRSPGDQRHTVVTNVVTRLPFDVRMSAIGTFGSGITINATDASQGRGIGRERSYVFTPPGRSFLGVGQVFNTQTLDLRLEKGLPLPGGSNVSVLADVFNLFNNANFGCYADNATILPVAEQDAAYRTRYGTPNCAGLGRRLQIGLRAGYRASTFSGAGGGATTGTR